MIKCSLCQKEFEPKSYIMVIEKWPNGEDIANFCNMECLASRIEQLESVKHRFHTVVKGECLTCR